MQDNRQSFVTKWKPMFDVLHNNLYNNGNRERVKNVGTVAVGVLALFLSLSLLSCSQKLKENELAKIDNLAVSESHFVSAFKEYYYRSGRSLAPSERNKEAILEAEFSPYVLATYARGHGWDQDRSGQRRLEMIKRKVYAEEYREQFVLDTVRVTGQDIRELFVRFNTTLRASHLYAPDRKTADSLYTALQNGASFEQLAAETFRNRYLAQNGGDIGSFSVNDVDLAFENAAFELSIGEISEPVKTTQGYSIIKLTERKTKPIITQSQFASKRDHLKSIAQNRAEEMAIRRHLRQVTQKLQLDRQLLSRLWKQVSDQQEKFWSLTRGEQSLNIGSLAERDLSRHPEFTFTGKDFLRESYFTPDESRSRIYREFDFEQYVKGLAFRSYIIEQFKNTKAFEASAVQGSIDETFYNYLNNRVLDTLRANIKLTEEELKREFQRNRSQYKEALEINLARIVVSSKAEGERVIRKLQNGQHFKQVLKEHTINSEDLMTDGELGYQSIRKMGPMAPKVKDMQPGEIGGPYQYHSDKFYVYKCLARKQSRALSFEEARERVRQNLKRQKLEKEKQQLIERTKKKHNALVDLEKLENLTIKI